MAAGLGMNQLQEEIERFKEMLQLMAQGGKEEVENIFRYVDQRLTDLYRMIRVVIEQEQRKQGLDHSDRNRRASLSDKSFSYYTEEDIRRMNETVALLAQRLKNRLAVRRKKAARGRFDVKETRCAKICSLAASRSVSSSIAGKKRNLRSLFCATYPIP